jgi:2-hydroxy-3-oxopropionate reductase
MTVVCGEGGALEAMRPGSIVAIHSTIHPKTPARVAEAGKAKGVGVLDAQVSGGQGGARAQTLTYMVGGERELFDRCLPVFQTSGKNIFHVGPLGAGSATKLAQQVIVCLNRMSAYEGMMLAKKAGVDLEMLQAVVRTTSAQSAIVENWLRDFGHIGDTDRNDPDLMAHLFWKGLVPALELGHEVGHSMPATALVQQTFPRILGLDGKD